MNDVIGISGKQRTGKDSAGKIIKELFPASHICRFSDKVKQRVALSFPNWFNIDKWENNGDEYREALTPLGISRRKLLEKEGTNVCREIHPDYWIHALFESSLFNNVHYIKIITDVRFPNEVEAIQKRGGKVIRLERWIDEVFGVERALNLFNKDIPIYKLYSDSEALIEDISEISSAYYYATQIPQNNHESNTALDDYKFFDKVIENNQSINALKFKLIKTLKSWQN